MKVEEYVRELKQRLSPLYGEGEATAMVRLIFNSIKGWSVTDLVVNGDREVSDFLKSEVEKVITRVEAGEPIQYVLGQARFYGMDLKVDSRVLIPRPETEGLVDLIVDKYKDKDDLRILDMGTGSGAIAIALARNLPFSKVSAIDISAGALEVAKENARNLKANIDFKQADIFSFQPEQDSYDIIVSNPPYIPDDEKKDMEKNVLEYEPAGALFVPDSDPIRFYIRIAEVARMALVPGGTLYFEINPRFASDISDMLAKNGFEDIEIEKDMFKRDRFIIARKGEEN